MSRVLHQTHQASLRKEYTCNIIHWGLAWQRFKSHACVSGRQCTSTVHLRQMTVPAHEILPTVYTATNKWCTLSQANDIRLYIIYQWRMHQARLTWCTGLLNVTNAGFLSCLFLSTIRVSNHSAVPAFLHSFLVFSPHIANGRDCREWAYYCTAACKLLVTAYCTGRTVTSSLFGILLCQRLTVKKKTVHSAWSYDYLLELERRERERWGDIGGREEGGRERGREGERAKRERRGKLNGWLNLLELFLNVVCRKFVLYSRKFVSENTVKLQTFVRYPFSYFWLETGSYQLIFVLSRASKQNYIEIRWPQDKKNFYPVLNFHFFQKYERTISSTYENFWLYSIRQKQP